MADRYPRAIKELIHGFLQLYPGEAAGKMEALPLAETVRLLEEQSPERLASIASRFTPDLAAQVVERVKKEAARIILTSLEPSRAAALLSRLENKERERLLRLLPSGAAAELKELMQYPPDSAGSLMDHKVMTLDPEMTVRQARARLRTFGRRRIQEVFLVDEDGRLEGVVPLLDLAIAPPSEKLEQLKRQAAASVNAMNSREEVVEILSHHRLASLPVVDIDSRVLGVIRYDTLVEAAQHEASADIQTMVGASKEERALSKVSFAVRKRLLWLEVNLGTAFLAAAVVGLFESTIARFTALAVLLPVVAGQSGNTGAQALAVTMRGLALREIRVRQWLRILFKELNVGFLNGVVVALTTSLFVYLWSKSGGLALVIGTSMVASMTIAGLAGAAVPLVLTGLRQDPAQSSSIILTTVTDVAGFFSFLGIATLLMGML